MVTATPRKATESDVPELVRVINAAYRVEDFFIDGDRTNASDVRERMTNPNGTFLVIEGAQPSTLAAALYVEVRGARGYFGLLSVEPQYQKQGLARILVSAAEDHCRAAGCTCVDIDVVTLRTELPAFYDRLGFKPIGTAAFSPTAPMRPGYQAHLVVMTKPLMDEGGRETR